MWIIVLAIWIIFLTWIWWFFTCGPKSAGPVDDGCDKMSITDGNNLSYEGEGNVKFLRSSSNLILTDSYLDNALATVNNYLIDNPRRAVTITGNYEDSESNGIGLARANEIKEIFLKNGVKENQVLTRSSAFEPQCTNGDTLYKAASFTFGVAQ
jgi:outer membrane protein OmpA-like peptidoglycan-associated protein